MAALESIWIDGLRSVHYAEWFYSLFSAYPIERWQLADKVDKAVNLKGVRFCKVREILSAIWCSQSTPLFNFALTAYEASFTASHSIVETRIAIARELLSMLSIKMLRFKMNTQTLLV